MPDYKEMYLKLFRAAEEAVNLLIAAQRECEELYMNAPEHPLEVLDRPKEEGETPEQPASPERMPIP